MLDIYYNKKHLGKNVKVKNSILEFAEICKNLNIKRLNKNKIRRIKIIINWLRNARIIYGWNSSGVPIIAENANFWRSTVGWSRALPSKLFYALSYALSLRAAYILRPSTYIRPCICSYSAVFFFIRFSLLYRTISFSYHWSGPSHLTSI